MHKPYETILNHIADFKVKYRFKPAEEGGRKMIPFQGIRCDFSYEGAKENEINMIWPEFEDTDGNIILENDKSVPISGTARMWIINAERRPYHYDKIKVGVRGFFREGSMFTAECEVIEVLGLMNNPKTNKK